jgi:hypothetical protein
MKINSAWHIKTPLYRLLRQLSNSTALTYAASYFYTTHDTAMAGTKQGEENTPMSFTTDELESFNTILEQRLAAHSNELERIFEQRTQLIQREFEQRLIAAQLTIIDTLTTQMQAQLEGIVDHALASQLLAIEELLKQYLLPKSYDETPPDFGNGVQQFDTIEVQTDLPWEELNDLFGKALDERFNTLNETTQAALSNMEQVLSARLQGLQFQVHELVMHSHQTLPYTDQFSAPQEALQNIGQLERLVESLQVTMTSNHALLSNRLLHHLQLPLEQAHRGNQDHRTEETQVQVAEVRPNGTGKTYSFSEGQDEQ